MARVEQWRGDALEAVHPFSAVRVDAQGRVVDVLGDDRVTTWRSAAKPFQLEVSAGLCEGPWADEDLAVGAASHSAEAEHVARVGSLLARFGAEIADLRCGAHAPAHEGAARRLVLQGCEPTAVHNNCSGKHAFMVGACRACGWASDYRDPDHPLQQRIVEVITRRSGVRPGHVVDGCGVPCFVLPLSAMARAWGSIAADDGLLGRIGRAMAAAPWFTSGTGRVELEVMRAAPGRLVAKVGAEGLMCGVHLERGEGFALKVHSGHDEARAAAFHAVLDRWWRGIVPAEPFEPWTVVRNVVGAPVGQRRVAFDVCDQNGPA